MAARAPSAAARAETVDQACTTWRGRLTAAQEAQKAYHGRYALALAFAAGEQWVGWHNGSNELRSIRDLDDRYKDKDLYTADRIIEYRQAALGELSQDDSRPQLLAQQTGDDAEQAARASNRFVGYLWDREWRVEPALDRARELCVDLGLSAIRCCWNPDQGSVAGHLAVDGNGQPLNEQDAMYAASNGTLPDGSLPRYQPVKEGRTCLEVYSAFQILPPPGVTHEDAFKWEALRQVALVDDVKDLYGVNVHEDTDIANSIGLPASVAGQAGQKQRNRLKDHCWLFPCFDRPSRRYPNGRTLVFAGSQMVLCDIREGLDYTLEEQPHTGIVYLHWWRRSDRFQSQGLVDRLIDPQRIINRRKTQNVELVDAGMPKLIVRKGDWPETQGKVMEIVELEAQAQAPQPMQGSGPGGWMYQDIESLDEDMGHASTVSPLRLGENPQGIDTYAQLALLNDNEQGKREGLIKQHRQAAANIVDLGLCDVRRYWPDSKQDLVEGEDGRLELATFRKSDIPDSYRVKPATGSALPRSQGAQIKKVDAIWQAAVESQAVIHDPDGWTAWYKESYEAGEAQDLPTRSPSTQQQLAQLENMLMRQGEDVEPAYYDDIAVHLPIHRQEEDQARAAGDVELAQRIEQHILRSRELAVQANQQTAPQPPPAGPSGPPGAPPVPPQPLPPSASNGPTVPPITPPPFIGPAAAAAAAGAPPDVPPTLGAPPS